MSRKMFDLVQRLVTGRQTRWHVTFGGVVCLLLVIIFAPQPILAHVPVPGMPIVSQCPQANPPLPGSGGPSSPGAGCQSGICPSSSSASSSGSQCACSTAPPADSSMPVSMTPSPVSLYWGGSYERATDLELNAPGMNWSLRRSYSSASDAAAGNLPQGNKWISDPGDFFLYQGTSGTIIVVADAMAGYFFSTSGSGYATPGDSYLSLTHDTTNSQFILTDPTTNRRWTFYDFSTSNPAPGRLKEQTTFQLNAQSIAGFTYSYSTAYNINQITTPGGQDYSIVYTYNGSYIKSVAIKDPSGTLLAQVDYTYYQDVTSPSTDIGNTGDLVQVKVSKRATTDTGSTLSIVRYTQYRYISPSNLKTVYEHDAIQRILASTGLSSPTAILCESDSYGTPAIHSFATRSFTYYGQLNAPPATVNTAFSSSENIGSEYGGAALSGSDPATRWGLLQSETIGGCGGCGTANSVTKTYYYLAPSISASSNQNIVTRLVVEDTTDSAGTGIYRTIYGLDGDDDGAAPHLLRRAFIHSPVASPTFWCDSWIFATSTGSTALPYRLAEHRYPSAHTGVTSNSTLRTFLNPYNGSSWSNDTSTVNSSSGQIESYAYNSVGLQTASLSNMAKAARPTTFQPTITGTA